MAEASVEEVLGYLMREHGLTQATCINRCFGSGRQAQVELGKFGLAATSGACRRFIWLLKTNN
jgi:hypothetical protein